MLKWGYDLPCLGAVPLPGRYFCRAQHVCAPGGPLPGPSIQKVNAPGRTYVQVKGLEWHLGCVHMCLLDYPPVTSRIWAGPSRAFMFFSSEWCVPEGACGWDRACGMQPQSSKCVLTIQTNFRKCEQANNFFFFFCFILLRGTALDGMNKSHSES